MKMKARWLLTLGLGVAFPLLTGAGTAPAASSWVARSGAVYHSRYISATFRVTAFKASAEETWDWSVTNQANNSGWATSGGNAEWSATMPPSRQSKKPTIEILESLAGNRRAESGIVEIPVHASYSITSAGKTSQHPSTSCSDKGPAGKDVFVQWGPAQSNPRHPKLESEAVTFVWPDLHLAGTGVKCAAEGMSAKAVWFKKVEVMNDLAKEKGFTVHAKGSIPIPVTSTEDCYGCIGFKGQGTYEWKVSMTLHVLSVTFKK
ncbi:MAG: hypothetical protein ABSC51_03935 [Gaiellaceae bacterium]